MDKTKEELELELMRLKLEMLKIENQQLLIKSRSANSSRPKKKQEKKIFSRILQGHVIPQGMRGESLPKIRIEVEIEPGSGRRRLSMGKEKGPWEEMTRFGRIVSHKFANGETWYYALGTILDLPESPFRLIVPKPEQVKVTLLSN